MNIEKKITRLIEEEDIDYLKEFLKKKFIKQHHLDFVFDSLIKYDKIELLREFLKNFSINYSNIHRMIYLCKWRNKFNIIIELLPYSDKTQRLLTDLFETSLENNKSEFIEFILNNNLCFRFSINSLYKLIIRNNVDLVKKLLEKTIILFNNYSLINYVVEKGSREMLKIFLKDPRIKIDFDIILSSSSKKMKIFKEHLSKRSLLYFNEDIEFLINEF